MLDTHCYVASGDQTQFLCLQGKSFTNWVSPQPSDLKKKKTYKFCCLVDNIHTFSAVHAAQNEYNNVSYFVGFFKNPIFLLLSIFWEVPSNTTNLPWFLLASWNSQVLASYIIEGTRDTDIILFFIQINSLSSSYIPESLPYADPHLLLGKFSHSRTEINRGETVYTALETSRLLHSLGNSEQWPRPQYGLPMTGRCKLMSGDTPRLNQ